MRTFPHSLYHSTARLLGSFGIAVCGPGRFLEQHTAFTIACDSPLSPPAASSQGLAGLIKVLADPRNLHLAQFLNANAVRLVWAAECGLAPRAAIVFACCCASWSRAIRKPVLSPVCMSCGNPLLLSSADELSASRVSDHFHFSCSDALLACCRPADGSLICCDQCAPIKQVGLRVSAANLVQWGDVECTASSILGVTGPVSHLFFVFIVALCISSQCRLRFCDCGHHLQEFLASLDLQSDRTRKITTFPADPVECFTFLQTLLDGIGPAVTCDPAAAEVVFSPAFMAMLLRSALFSSTATSLEGLLNVAVEDFVQWPDAAPSTFEEHVERLLPPGRLLKPIIAAPKPGATTSPALTCLKLLLAAPLEVCKRGSAFYHLSRITRMLIVPCCAQLLGRLLFGDAQGFALLAVAFHSATRMHNDAWLAAAKASPAGSPYEVNAEPVAELCALCDLLARALTVSAVTLLVPCTLVPLMSA